MKITESNIGNVFKLKEDCQVYIIDIQTRAKLVGNNNYVLLENTCFISDLFFGKLVESNLFGPIIKGEIEFNSSCINEEEQFENLEDFNQNKTIKLYY